MFVHVYTSIYAYMQVGICIFLYMYICRLCMYMHMYVTLYIYICMYVHRYIDLHIYIILYIHMYATTYTYIHIYILCIDSYILYTYIYRAIMEPSGVRGRATAWTSPRPTPRQRAATAGGLRCKGVRLSAQNPKGPWEPGSMYVCMYVHIYIHICICVYVYY